MNFNKLLFGGSTEQRMGSAVLPTAQSLSAVRFNQITSYSPKKAVKWYEKAEGAHERSKVGK